MTNSITCPECKARFVQVNNSTKSYAQSLPTPQLPPAPASRMPSVPTPLWQSKTGQRLAQMCISCVVVSAAVTFPSVITGTAATVWIVSLVGGVENWGKIKDLLDRNKDGRVDLNDVKKMVDWWKADDDEPTAPKPPDIWVSVASGNTVTRQPITGTTEAQWKEAAFVMASITSNDGKFSRDRVGSIFGDNKEFGRVQREMVQAGLLVGGRYAGYKLTTAGRAFLANYRPSPTPAE